MSEQVCKRCGNPVERAGWKFCSISCKCANNGSFTAIYHRERVLSKTPTQILEEGRAIDPVRGCWLWNKGRMKSGYGEVRLIPGQKPIYVHRLSAELFLGKPPTSDSQALHRCDVKACFNPKHLYWGNRIENAADAVQRGRSAKGERNGTAVLSPDIISEMRGLFVRGFSQQSIANIYGVTQSCVSNVYTRKTWSHIK